MATANGVYNTTSTMHNEYYTKQISRISELFKFHPALYSKKQKAVIPNTWVDPKFSGLVPPSAQQLC